MGKKKGGESSASSTQDLLQTLEDFTSKENWDKFFTIRGTDDSFEWYAEWPQLRDPLLSLLPSGDSTENAHLSSSLQILIPGCGNSRLSEHLYDAGFCGITNVDFSKVVISDMLRRNIRSRPEMRWRVMDMTKMELADESFNVVLDKGGLDALMEPDVGAKLGNQYLSEVKRVLKPGGKFICLTLAESHVIGVLFSRFRFGWKTTIHYVPQKPSSKPSLTTFMVVAEKENSGGLLEISSAFDLMSLDCKNNQASGLREVLGSENRVRREYYTGSDVRYSHEDLLGGVKGDLTMLSEGRRIQFTLGGQGSCFSYKAVMLDAHNQSTDFLYHCGIFLVPKTRCHEWLFSSEEGQWQVVESSKAARLVMVFLDSSHVGARMEDIQQDLSPMVKHLAPITNDAAAPIPYMMASDGIKERHIVHQVTSPLTGQVVVEDVVYENAANGASQLSPSRHLKFRRLVFQRTEGLIQSEALLIDNGSAPENADQAKRRKAKSSTVSKRKGNKSQKSESNSQSRICHGYLASSYHTGIISGFGLIFSYLKDLGSAGKMVKTIVIGLGAGLLPMFLHGCIPFLAIEAVELDPMMLNLAEDYFGFIQGARLKVHIADGVKFVKEMERSPASAEINVSPASELKAANSSGRSTTSLAESKNRGCCDVLIIDVDSSDSSSGLTCPAADFVEESFLITAKHVLSEHGLFIVNLVSRSQTVKDMVVSRMKKVFNHLFCLQVEEDVNLVLFAFCSESTFSDTFIPDSAVRLETLLNSEDEEMRQSIVDTAKKLKRWK